MATWDSKQHKKAAHLYFHCGPLKLRKNDLPKNEKQSKNIVKVERVKIESIERNFKYFNV